MALNLIKRAVMVIVVLFGVSILSFILSAISPVDPAEAFARRTLLGGVTPEKIAEIRIQMGTDQPMPAQYLRWLRGIIRGDFGISLMSRKPVAADIAAYLPLTLKLSGLRQRGAALLLITHHEREAEYCGCELLRVGGDRHDD